MKGFADVLELFERFPSQEFDKVSVHSQVYVSEAQVYRILSELVSARILTYREIGTATTKKKLWRLTNPKQPLALPQSDSTH